MVTEKLKQLSSYQIKIEELQIEIDQERRNELAHLHEKFGYETTAALIKALRATAGTGGRRGGRGPARHRKHARITTDMREKIKAALQDGKSGAKVAKQFGISLPSVYNIKKAFGLVKSRKKK
jgi:DNA invertase Pin-like site-specific DNA recombinase